MKNIFMILLTLTQKVKADDAILGFYVQWLEKMAQRVEHLQVIALETGAYDLPPNVEVISLNKERGAGPVSMFLTFNRVLWRLCRTHKPDAILAHMVPKYVLYALPLARLFRVPVDLWYTHKGVDKYLRMAHPFIRHAFTASEESFRLKSRKKVIFGHGIDTSFFVPPEKEERKGIITVGRITPSKDQEVLLKAVALLRERRPGEKLETRIIGEPLLESDELYMQHLKELVQESSLEGCILFEGAKPHGRMRDYYGRARIVVNASHTGSLDKVVLEAMATGAVPLTCNESFVPLLGDLTELLFFEKKNANDLASRIDYLLDLDREAYLELGAKLRSIVCAKHDLDRLMDRMIEKMSNPT
ncbi:MAG: glycosyltransferase family 4 protein [Planctomycetota bacterium]